MSHLGIALKRIAEENKREQKEIADAAQVAQSQVSRWFSGLQKTISDPDFAAVLAVITKDPRQRAEIIAARCRDVKIGPGAELVEITVKGKAEKKGAKPEI